VSATVAYVALDGIHVTNETRVVGGSGATRPRWSADGAWLAYQDDASALWVVRANGGSARKIADNVHQWEWAPRGARIAVTHTDTGQLVVIDLERGGSWTAPGQVNDFIWSPDGARIAYSVFTAAPVGSRVDDVFVARLDTPERNCVVLCPDVRKVAFRFGGGGMNGAVDVGVFFAGWSPNGTTLLIWTDGYHSGSIAMDGLGLHELPVAGGTTRPVTMTLIRRDWIAWSPNGERFATVESTGRTRGDSPRRIVVCTLATASCRLIADHALDPAWSPDGTQISFVRADEQPPSNPNGWAVEYARRTLVVAATDGTHQQNIHDSSGAASPQWLDNHTILFVHDGGLWIVNQTTGQHTELNHAIGLPGGVPPPEAYEATDLVGYAWTNSFNVRGR